MVIVKDAKTGKYLCYKTYKDIPDDKPIFFLSNSEQVEYISDLVEKDNIQKEESVNKNARSKS